MNKLLSLWALRMLGILVLPLYAVFVLIYMITIKLFGRPIKLSEAMSDIWDGWKMAYWE